MHEHKAGKGSKYAKRYDIKFLVYYEVFGDIERAIAREKQLKRWRSVMEDDLINSDNPEWNDLAIDF